MRQALDYRSTLRAFAVVIIGWLLFVAIRDLGVPWLLRYLTPPAGHGRQRAVSRHPVISLILATVTSST